MNCQTWPAIDKEKAAVGEILRSGGQILVDQLVAQGVERVYCVPGESYLAALDAMNGTPIEVTVCRQEAGAAMMALTEGRLTARPGRPSPHGTPPSARPLTRRGFFGKTWRNHASYHKFQR